MRPEFAQCRQRPVGPAFRMQAGAPQDLVGEQIAEPGEHGLDGEADLKRLRRRDNSSSKSARCTGIVSTLWLSRMRATFRVDVVGEPEALQLPLVAVAQLILG